MIRMVLENLILFLLPTIIYLLYAWMMRPEGAGGPGGRKGPVAPLDDAPLVWLFATGAILVITTLVLFQSNTGGKPGQHYTPPSFEDGHIEPGEIK